MKRVQQHRRNQGRVYRTIVAAALALGGTLHMVTAVLANGTAAGTRITNEATATYEDPNDPNNTPITTTSNEVVVQVAEVAGITVQPAGIDFIEVGIFWRRAMRCLEDSMSSNVVDIATRSNTNTAHLCSQRIAQIVTIKIEGCNNIEILGARKYLL